MSRIRHNLALVAIVIAVAILAFVVQDGCQRAMGGSQGVPDVGEISGEKVSYEEYGDLYRVNLENERRRTGGASIPDARRYQIMDDTWNQLVSDKVYENELDEIGLKVTGAELADIFTGQNLPSYIVSSFQGLSQTGGDPTGAEIRQYITDVLPTLPRDQQIAFKDFETSIKEFRARERYNNMVKAGYVSSQKVALDNYMQQNTRRDIAFLAVNYTSIPDSSVTLSDGDYQKYIDARSKQFKQEPETNIRYVRFQITPSKEDTTRAYNGIMKWKEPFGEALADSVYTSNKTRFPFRNQSVAISDLPPAIQDDVVSAEPKTVFGPFLEGSFYKLYKLVGTQDSSTSWAKINHIMIRPTGNTPADSAEARSKAASLARSANSGNFASLAEENSMDFATKSNGGTLGWTRKGMYGPDFDEAIDNAGVGRIIGPIKSTQGYHVVQVVAKTNKTYGVAEVEKEIFAGNNTIDQVNKEANVFAAKAMSMKDIEAAASEANLASFASGPLLNDTKTLPGVSEGARDLILWSLKADVSDFSEVQEAGDSYVFAQVINRKPEGTKSVADLRAQLRTQVLNEKKAEIILNKMSGLDNSDLNAMASAYGEGAFIDNAQGVTFAANSIAKIGNDPLVIGTVSGLDEGMVSAPIKGVNGVYVVQVTKVNAAAEASPEVLTTQKTTDKFSGQNQMVGRLDQALRELADVKDTRHEANY